MGIGCLYYCYKAEWMRVSVGFCGCVNVSVNVDLSLQAWSCADLKLSHLLRYADNTHTCTRNWRRNPYQKTATINRYENKALANLLPENWYQKNTVPKLHVRGVRNRHQFLAQTVSTVYNGRSNDSATVARPVQLQRLYLSAHCTVYRSSDCMRISSKRVLTVTYKDNFLTQNVFKLGLAVRRLTTIVCCSLFASEYVWRLLVD